MIENIKKELIDLSDKKYKNFSSSLLPNIDNILGVKLPILRKIAKRILKNDWQNFIKKNTDDFFELTMIEGMIISSLKIDYTEHLKLIENFIPKINCWSICDSFISGLKTIEHNKELTKKFLEKYFNSNKEYELRFCYVVLLNYFIDSDINFVLEKIKQFNNNEYYAKMGVAWCLSICIIHNFEKSIDFIKNNQIHSWTVKKGITKAIESLRLNESQKEILRNSRSSL